MKNIKSLSHRLGIVLCSNKIRCFYFDSHPGILYSRKCTYFLFYFYKYRNNTTKKVLTLSYFLLWVLLKYIEIFFYYYFIVRISFFLIFHKICLHTMRLLRIPGGER